MEVPTYDFKCEQGATFNRLLVWDYLGAPKDLTDATVKMTIYAGHISNQQEGKELTELSTANGRITTVPEGGRICMLMLATDTYSLPVGRHYYKIDVTFIKSGEVRLLLKGDFIVNPENMV